MNQTILTVSLCLMIRDERILLIRRANAPYQGWLGLPGGKVRFGERPAEAAQREATEETGLTCACARILGCATETITRSEAVAAHFTMFPVLLTDISGTLQSGREGDLFWISLNELRSRSDMIPTDLDLIERYYRTTGQSQVYHYDVVEEDGSLYCLRRIHPSP